MDKILWFIKKFIPKNLFDSLAPLYHYALAVSGALIYRFPSKHITTIAVTGTKGKSSTIEMLNAMFEAGGHKTALLGTIRFKIGDESRPNKTKMTIPGRFFVQKFLRQAVKSGCSVAILEMSSEAAKQYRHKFIYLDALVFTNLSPEHIESHGSFEKYRKAKLEITKVLKKKLKPKSVVVANADDPNADLFLKCGAEESYPYSLSNGEPYTVDSSGIRFTYKGVEIKSGLRGVFNLYNLLGASVCADAFGVPTLSIKEGVERLSLIRGRVEFVKLSEDNPNNSKQNFDVIVDYAHTAGSLGELYKTFEGQRKVCVFGNTGGGRDKWKRPEMAKVADNFCDEVILTNEDPYDEDPKQIISDMLPGFKKNNPEIIMDRREAIHAAISKAKNGDAVLITGKGTDPAIMLADGKRLEWSDYEVAKEELEKILK
ncbi:MAG: UDP-N-acetylmuramoyl-L-alanyl-D-glutamate--2,6-diaminopimelate ligase [Parcubacteria bacterium C7867-005]|nr:MAG: UDP-N-acetylmuramoyl-L-alanyl-D-glutamate--2,6-diaminopimelate ligase [Parcubacteria bacterium C7867-005]